MKNINLTTDALKFSRKLKEWYWKHGVKRQNEYELSRTRWLAPLCNTNIELEAIHRQNMPRPSTAIWGPSQTGKSTLVARYIDEMSRDSKGNGTALHWEGGEGAYFSLPRGASADSFDSNVTVLNPYNGGMDASACITRFTKGSLESGAENSFWVKNPSFPVAIRFSNKTEITLSVARGYHGQCVQENPNKLWNLRDLKELIKIIDSREDQKNLHAEKDVFDDALSLCQVIEDLAFAKLPRYRSLLTDEKNSEEIRELILGSKALVSSKKALNSFKAEILWDDSKPINEFYIALLKNLEKQKEIWGEREIFCSLEAASSFLDMDSFSMFNNGSPVAANEELKEVRVNRILSGLEFNRDVNNVFIGRGKGQGNRLFTNPNEFGVFQGLIQEVVIPLNLKNLKQSPFLEFIKNFDLLDFPGVERGGQSSSSSKIVLTSKKDEFSLTETIPWESFLTKVLKRGKTATLFQGYSRKLLIDTVSIFQDLDNDKPNAQDLITGVETWWRSTDSKRPYQSTEKSPLPLNCVMTWWAKMLNESPANRATIFGKNQNKYEQLGLLANPNVANLLAINDSTLPRGRLNTETKKILPALIKTIRNEPQFKKLFSFDQNRESFRSMVEDKDGGMDFFFTTLITQVKSSTLRDSFWSEKSKCAVVKLEALLMVNGLLPKSQSKEKDRVHYLQLLHELLAEDSEYATTGKRIKVENGLKQILNVNEEELESLPIKSDDLNQSFIRRQFSKKGKCLFNIQDEGEEVCWKLLGFTSEEEAQLSWHAICMSIEPNLKEILDWLRTIIKQQTKFKMIDYRRFLAVRMSNEFLGSDRTNTSLIDSGESHYQKSPIIEASKNRISQFMNLKLKHPGRNEQDGDHEIKNLYESFTGKTEETN